MLSPESDGYGRVIYDHYRGLRSAEVIERDDGWVETSAGAPAYFAPFDEWPPHQRRGVRDARVLPITRVSRRLGEFDTIAMLGNNFGLFGSPRRAHWLLARFRGLTSPTARILAELRHPYRTNDPDHRRYHQRNRRRGRLPGQLRLRVRCGGASTPWFDYLLVSPRRRRSAARSAAAECPLSSARAGARTPPPRRSREPDLGAG
jgi:hypothetical protein